MNNRPGIDTSPPEFALYAKLNVPFDNREHMVSALRALRDVMDRKLHPERLHGGGAPPASPRHVVSDLRLNLLVGFGLPFFMGPLHDRQPEEIVPNFPPGGQFAPRTPRRFGIDDRGVPLYLRTMAASLDDAFVAKRKGAELGRDLNPDETRRAYVEWLQSCESDLVLYIEADNRWLVYDLWAAIRSEVVVPFGLALASPLQEGFNRGDGRDHTGWFDGLNNLQDRIEDDPHGYRQQIYLPHAAPAYPGEPTEARDDPRYDGGTYMVLRKYQEHLDRWNDPEFQVSDAFGSHKGEEARRRAMGRDRETGRVIDRTSGALLDPEPDGTEVERAYDNSHILQARGGTRAPFSHPFPPLLEEGQQNVFETQDIRIRRRGVNFAELDPASGSIRYGLHFVCFQNNIQQTGFEFINNVWLLNPAFRGHIDSLFDPDAGIIEPLEGAYYFVPPEGRHYPGDVFFEYRKEARQ